MNTTTVAHIEDFDTIIKELVRLALDNDISKHSLLDFVSDEYNKVRDNRRSPQ